MLQKRFGFTMIELVFVIVVLGILAAVAVPRLAATRTDAEISAGAATVAAIRSGIVGLRQQRILMGQNTWPVLNSDFSNVLTYPVKFTGSNGVWSNTSPTTWTYTVDGVDNNFNYNINFGTFNCTSGIYCNALNGT